MAVHAGEVCTSGHIQMLVFDEHAIADTLPPPSPMQEHYDRMAESAIKRLGDALWVGVTERSDEADCLLFLALGKGSTGMGSSRHKEPRPISVRQVWVMG